MACEFNFLIETEVLKVVHCKCGNILQTVQDRDIFLLQSSNSK